MRAHTANADRQLVINEHDEQRFIAAKHTKRIEEEFSDRIRFTHTHTHTHGYVG